MNITLWGTRGSLSCAGPESVKYGGNTSCIQIQHDQTCLIFDAGTGIRRLGVHLNNSIKTYHVFLTHLHLDHIQGLGFFMPLFNSESVVHIYGPAISDEHLREQLSVYLSPPLFPVLLPDLPCELYLHAQPSLPTVIDNLTVKSAIVIHPGLTVGYRIQSQHSSICYIPDHEPAFGVMKIADDPAWLSGFELANGVDVLIHDAQYNNEEYIVKMGWGHSSYYQAVEFAKMAQVKLLVTFHHDPSHDDDILIACSKELMKLKTDSLDIIPGTEGLTLELK